MKPFHPIVSSTVKLAATAVTGGVDLTKTPSGEFNLRLVNVGPNVAFIRFGVAGATTAALTDMPLPIGTEVITIRNISSADAIASLAAICAATETATVYATVGQGI